MSDRRFAAYLIAVTCAAIALLAVLPGSADAAQAVSTTARGAVHHDEFCPGVASTTLAATYADRKNITIQNLSSATCYVSFEPFQAGTLSPDPTDVVTTGKHGYKFAIGDQGSFDFGSSIPVRAACTAATTTGACLQIMQVQ